MKVRAFLTRLYPRLLFRYTVFMESVQKQEIKLYLHRAKEAIQAATHNLNDGFYIASVNRSYYAVFYATSALLLTDKISRRKHHGVVSAFRHHFVKPERIEREYSDIYGRLLDHRETGDYMIFESVNLQQAKSDLTDAQRFVKRIEDWLKEEDWL